MKEEYSAEDLRYLRVGPINRGRPVDSLVDSLVTSIPGDGVLPSRWGFFNKEHYLNKYSSLGSLLWAKATSSHLLIKDGVHVIRMWTDSANTAVVDISPEVEATLEGALEVEDIPESVMRKCKPFTRRIRVATTDDLDLLLSAVKRSL